MTITIVKSKVKCEKCKKDVFNVEGKDVRKWCWCTLT